MVIGKDCLTTFFGLSFVRSAKIVKSADQVWKGKMRIVRRGWVGLEMGEEGAGGQYEPVVSPFWTAKVSIVFHLLISPEETQSASKIRHAVD